MRYCENALMREWLGGRVAEWLSGRGLAARAPYRRLVACVPDGGTKIKLRATFPERSPAVLFVCRVLFAVLTVILNHLGDNLFHRAGNHVVGNFVDGGVGVAVDADDDAAVLHARDVLDLAADAAGDVYLRVHRDARLTNLAVVVNPSGIDGGAAAAHFAVEHFGQLEEAVEALLAAHAIASGNPDGTPPAGLMAVPADCVNGCWRIESERKTKGAPEAAQLVRSLVSDPEKLICPDPSEPPRRIEYSDIMIITVSKEDTDQFRNALRALGIPAVVEGSVSFVSSLALAELTKLIAAASDMNDGIALCAALTGRLIGLTETRLASVGRSDKAIAAVKEDAPKKKDPERKDTGYVKPLTFYINADEPEKYFDKAADADILSAVKILTAVKLDACNMPASAVIQKAADDLRVFEKLGDDEMQFYTFALELLRDKEKTGEVTSLKEAADYLNGLLASNRSEERSLSLVRKPNAVHIANLHKVKGLESPIVILGTVSQSKSISPSNYSFADAEGRKKRIIFKVGGSGDKKNITYISTTVFDKYKDTAKENELDEYRRLHYVAATRAKCALFVCDKPEKPPKTTKTGKPAKKKCDPLDIRLPSYWKALTVDEDCSVMPLYTIDPKGDTGGAEAFDREDLYKKAEDDSLLKNKDERQKITRKFEKPHEEKLGSSAGSDKPSEDGEQSDPAAPAPAASADDKPRRFTSLAANKKGSFVHKLMELLVLSKGRAAGSIPTLIDRILDEADFEMTPVQEADCRTMLSEVADVMLNKGGYKQYGGAPQDLLPELWSAEKIYCELPICYEEYNTIVYGIIDMLYVSGGKWHIIDYKTDRDAAAAPAVHAGQLERYRQALIRINGIPAGDIDAHVYNVDIS